MLAYAFYDRDSRMRQYATALVERGDSVDVIALRRKGQAVFETLGGVAIYRKQLRIVNERGPFTYLFRILRFFFHSAVVLTKKHLENRYHVIHVHSVPDFLVFAALGPKLLGARIVLDIHDILPEFYAGKFNIHQDSLMFSALVWVERLSAAFADHVIISNHLWFERLTHRSVKPDKCTTICNYPDPKLFYLRPQATKNGSLMITYPGTLNWHQGVDIAIKAFAKVVQRIPDAVFHIYGEGPEKLSLARLANTLGLHGKVVFHEFVPLSEIVSVMSKSDVAVVPKRARSIFGNEAISTKILEFMALGVPVVVSRTKVDTYYYDDSIVKFFESENDSDLADTILALWEDEQFRARLVSNGQRYVEENNWGVKKKEYLDLVDSLLPRGPILRLNRGQARKKKRRNPTRFHL